MPSSQADSAPGRTRRHSRWPLSRGWTLLVVLLAVVFLLLRGVSLLAEPPSDTAIFTEQVVVVGVTGHPQLTETDRAVLGANLENVQVGAVSIRPRYVGDCAAAGWATLGAGRRTSGGSGGPTSTAGWRAAWSRHRRDRTSRWP